MNGFFQYGKSQNKLEALPVNNGGTTLVVLLLGDPHLLEGGERGEDGASDPDGVFPLGGSNDLDLDVALHDGVEGGLVDATSLHSQEGRLEEGLGAPEPLVANGDDLAVGKLV